MNLFLVSIVFAPLADHTFFTANYKFYIQLEPMHPIPPTREAVGKFLPTHRRKQIPRDTEDRPIWHAQQGRR